MKQNVPCLQAVLFYHLLNGANIAEVIQLNINKMDIRVLNIVL